ncbi:MAG: hypothetical protein AB7Q81_13990 [Gammaproteobacteria bacterium]
MHESFLSYRRFFFLKIATALCVGAGLAYLVHQPVDPPNGGTWLGYTLGGLGACLIGWLAWFGVRKRRYAHTRERLAAWLSAHVYLGLALVVVVTLHSGFQLGANVHTLAYGLTLAVVASGLWGLYAYVSYPRQIAANLGGLTCAALIAEVADIDRESLTLADAVGQEAHARVLASIEETVLGGTVRDLLFGDPARRAAAPGVGAALDEARATVERLMAGVPQALEQTRDNQMTVIGFLAGQGLAGDGGGAERLERIRRLFDLITRRRGLVERVQRDLQYRARLRFWLYLHVPLTVGLLTALVGHVVAVFFYW